MKMYSYFPPHPPPFPTEKTRIVFFLFYIKKGKRKKNFLFGRKAVRVNNLWYVYNKKKEKRKRKKNQEEKALKIGCVYDFSELVHIAWIITTTITYFVYIIVDDNLNLTCFVGKKKKRKKKERKKKIEREGTHVCMHSGAGASSSRWSSAGSLEV